MSKTKEHWQQHITAWQKTELSQAKYCKAHQLNQNQFSYWKHKLVGAVPSKSEATSAGFAIAQIAIPNKTSSNSTLSISLPNGTVISGIDQGNYTVVIKLMEAFH